MMDLFKYPFDTQICTMEMASCKYAIIYMPLESLKKFCEFHAMASWYEM